MDMRKILLASAVTLEVFASGAAFSQEADANVVQGVQAASNPATAAATTVAKDSLERITITATKREQTLRDVPISVSVTNADTLEKAKIVDLIDLQSVVPSLKVNQFNAVGQTNFIIRGFGNGGGNDGIESSVGVFVDGVYRSRTSSALDDLPEVQRIEVLRGPQSTLFGKNVSAGAISIITAKPQFKFGGNASIDIGNYNYRKERVSITGPLSETVAARLTVSDNKRDGFLRNDVTGSDINNRNRQAVRADVLWQPSSELTVRAIADYNRITEVCCGVVQVQNGPASKFIGAAIPGGLGALVSDPANKFNNRIAFNTDPTNRLTGQGLSVQADWRTSFGTLTSITANRKQTNASTQDVDFTGADLSNKNQANDISTFSQEIRFASKGEGPTRFLIGGFYQKEKLKTATDTTFGTGIRAFADGLSGKVPASLLAALPAPLSGALTGQSNIYAVEFLQRLVSPSINPGGTYFQAGQGILDHYTMNQDSYSIFGNLDYEVTENLTLTGGLAYLYDRKRAVSNVHLSDSFSALNLQAIPQFPAIGLPGNLYAPLNGLQFFYPDSPTHGPVNYPNANETGELSGGKLTKSLRAAYDFGAFSTYVSYNTGWKAGAYNLSSDSRPPNLSGIGRTAEPENVTALELGLKTESKNGYLTVAIFDQAIKGFQSNAYTGTGYALVNAGKQSTRGIEFDGAYKPLNWMSLAGALTYLDAKYDSFERAPCVSFDTARCPVNPVTGLTPNFRNLSGQRPAGIPKISFSTSAIVTHDLGSGNTGFARLEFTYSSKVQLADNTPAEVSTFGQKNVNASVGFISKPNHYELMFWARNLNNYRSVIGTFPTVAQSGSFSGFASQPRTFGVTLTAKF